METINLGTTIQLILDTLIETKPFTILRIAFKKPGGEMGHVLANREDNTKLRCRIELNEVGEWKFWADLENRKDCLHGVGDVVIIKVE